MVFFFLAQILSRFFKEKLQSNFQPIFPITVATPFSTMYKLISFFPLSGREWEHEKFLI